MRLARSTQARLERGSACRVARQQLNPVLCSASGTEKITGQPTWLTTDDHLARGLGRARADLSWVRQGRRAVCRTRARHPSHFGLGVRW